MTGSYFETIATFMANRSIKPSKRSSSKAQPVAVDIFHPHPHGHFHSTEAVRSRMGTQANP